MLQWNETSSTAADIVILDRNILWYGAYRKITTKI